MHTLREKKMNAKQIVSMISAVGLLTGFLYSQDLVELAKKEKERRAKAKDKKTVVITNADLKKKQVQPGIVVRRTAPVPEEEEATVTRSVSPRAAESGGAAKSPEKPPALTIPELEEKWRQANNAVGAATLKLNSLWQLYYSGGGMTSIERIQAEIGLTHLQLQELHKEADRLKKELDAAQAAEKK
jgi:hypothetical protein